jgi:hypothetical protein
MRRALPLSRLGPGEADCAARIGRLGWLCRSSSAISRDDLKEAGPHQRLAEHLLKSDGPGATPSSRPGPPMFKIIISARLRRILYVGLLMIAPTVGQASIDDDANGASDVWEAIHGPLLNPDADDDGDGFNNLEEARSGTSPNDPADLLQSLNASSQISMNVSIAGANFFQVDEQVLQYHVTTSGSIGLTQVDQTWAPMPQMYQAAHHMLNRSYGHLFEQEYARIMKRAVANDALLKSVLSTIPEHTDKFPRSTTATGGLNRVASQLRMILRLIEARTALGMKRQIFFASLGGAVNGGQLYGSMPILEINGPDDTGSRGSWIPKVSTDEMAATLARGPGPRQLAALPQREQHRRAD